jgi:hypothetical protein
MALGEASGPVERVDPNNHLVFIKLIRELVVVEVSFRGSYTVNLLEFVEIVAVGVLLLLVVVQQHLAADGVLVELIRLDVWLAVGHLAGVLVFLANDFGPGVQLLQVVDNSVLDVHVRLCEDIHAAFALDHLGEGADLSYILQDFVNALQNLDRCLKLNCDLTEKNSCSFTTRFIFNSSIKVIRGHVTNN